jgi:hypothetical protein
VDSPKTVTIARAMKDGSPGVRVYVVGVETATERVALVW